jgi:hypothetical protein
MDKSQQEAELREEVLAITDHALSNWFDYDELLTYERHENMNCLMFGIGGGP